MSDPEKETAAKEKGDNRQREKSEDVGPEAGEPGTCNRENAGTEKEEEDVPKEADHEEEGWATPETSEAGLKADEGGVRTLQPSHAPGGACLDNVTTESREGDPGCTLQPSKRDEKKEEKKTVRCSTSEGIDKSRLTTCSEPLVLHGPVGHAQKEGHVAVSLWLRHGQATQRARLIIIGTPGVPEMGTASGVGATQQKELAAKEKGDNGQREKREDAGPEAGEPGTCNGEDAGTEKEEEEVPKEADLRRKVGQHQKWAGKPTKKEFRPYSYATLLEDRG
ncbi:hypothetical protein NDU88_004944 [Pleurodeles waltl]|uniref:Uncharacterized protein n=1 Tax=Pleurodeles waltl TaxID=8319 RepID=A0AAV7QE64_PLEWA|nr:hypothetical protein NDU88_004944 [Pleurodeles waltl]